MQRGGIGTIATAIAAACAAIGALDEATTAAAKPPPEPPSDFEILERASDRSVDEAASESTRIGVLVASQIAVATVLVAKLEDFWLEPLMALFAVVLATGICYGTVCLVRPMLRHLPYDDSSDTAGAMRRTRAELPRCIEQNKRAATARRASFVTFLGLTATVCIWAFTDVIPHLGELESRKNATTTEAPAGPIMPGESNPNARTVRGHERKR